MRKVFPTLLIAVLAAVFSACATVPDTAERSPLPELDGTVAVVWSNCGTVTDVRVIDRSGELRVQGGGLVLQDVYEGARTVVEAAKADGQAWAVRSNTDCQSPVSADGKPDRVRDGPALLRARAASARAGGGVHDRRRLTGH